ncbi:MAG: DUF2155 domain-containing protein [Candidatus Pacebacteria bacterium]|nr:DUF2155 domain-containing protein [Candidatus Paceibacterota bacterium]
MMQKIRARNSLMAGYFICRRVQVVIALAVALMVSFWTGNAAAESTVILQALDKVTARISNLEAPIGKEIRFGTLRIIALKCRKQPPEETPDTAAFVQVFEVKTDLTRIKWFTGWMFAESPALNALEHPVYDVWVKDCK